MEVDSQLHALGSLSPAKDAGTRWLGRLRFVLILSFHLLVSVRSSLFSPSFATKILCAFLFPYILHALSISPPLSLFEFASLLLLFYCIMLYYYLLSGLLQPICIDAHVIKLLCAWKLAVVKSHVCLYIACFDVGASAAWRDWKILSRAWSDYRRFWNGNRIRWKL